MISAITWLIRKHPEVLVVLAGFWLVSMAWSFVIYFEGDSNSARYLRYVAHPFVDCIDIACTACFLTGCGYMLAGAARMIWPRLGRTAASGRPI
jgi:hypothetical protein